MEGRRYSRLVALNSGHIRFRVHLTRGQIGQGIDPFLDFEMSLTENLELEKVKGLVSHSVRWRYERINRPMNPKKLKVEIAPAGLP